MPLQSELFSGDAKLNDALNVPLKHITPGSSGPHVSKIHTALGRLVPNVAIAQNELDSKTYGDTTTEAVKAYKRSHVPPIINIAYQNTVDGIVGQMTIKALDRDLIDSKDSRVAKELAEDDKPMAITVALNAVVALNAIARDLDIMNSGASVDTGTARWVALQTHFHLLPGVTSGLGRAVTNADIATIRQQFLEIRQVFVNSAFTFQNGPSVVPGSPASGSFDKKQIFFAPLYKDADSADGAAIGPHTRVAILIHEGTHVVDSESGKPENHISEFDPAYDTQSAEQSMHNPSSYATFAWHVTRGFDRPRFGLGGPTRGM
jgi:hypothetical protein